MPEREDLIHKEQREVADLHSALDKTQAVLARAESADTAVRRALGSRLPRKNKSRSGPGYAAGIFFWGSKKGRVAVLPARVP